MTRKPSQTKTLLMTTTLAVITITVGLTPVFADNPPFTDSYWFDYSGDPEVCYLETELNGPDITGGTHNNGTDFVTATELSRAEYNSEIDGLTIAAEDSSCGYNKIEIGALSVPGSYIAQTVLVAYWCCGNYGEYAEMEFDFDDDTNWEYNSNECDIWNDKDPEYIANHELGHALSLGHHTGTDHSVMKADCTQKWSAVQSVDETALETRY